MATLGSFGAAVRELDPQAPRDTFDFFDETFTVHGLIPPMLMLQLGAAMVGKISELEGNAAMYEAFRCGLTKPAAEADSDGDDSQFDRFYRIAVDRRCDTSELVRLVFALIGAQAGLPTERQPTLQGGQPPTSQSSSSSSSDTPALVSVEDRLAGSV